MVELVSKYDPKGSSTSKKVCCNNKLCMQRNKCLGAFNTCPYRVSYVSDQTSTSGILVEDVLHLTTEDSHDEYVQSGSFLDISAPNGLFGLGVEKISVPSILTREGFTADSFSMCFGHDGVGRINFGDKGVLTRKRPHLIITLHSNPDANASWISGVSLTMKGGSQFEVYNPNIVISTESELVYSLAVVKSLELNIIGPIDPSTENFMTGYYVVFDREKKVLGWKKFYCYDTEDHHTYLPFKPRSYNVPPAFAHGLRNHSISESAKKTSQTSAASLPYYSHSVIPLFCFLSLHYPPLPITMVLI
ncbi:putative aspartic peptidase A1 family, xylanase inhibitor [Rosa chinensis]|uniref:Putative aspartic peptidase A1 family, xylanase inhibitor n=1 Tax=Rosa chinensis TaxID=74649 RepID=A0A2P6RLN2_ROSCH|nr:putative aspartic peptidase A1 family, xylanase inhibitor [Rosa chinensis]